MALDLTDEEVNAIMQVLSQLPTGSGAWPLLQKIQSQVSANSREQQ